MSLKITNIQRFSLHDGPGIRTTVFLKGCSIQCPWCCNPENIKKSAEFFFNGDSCITCGHCVEVCPLNLLEHPQDVLEIDESQFLRCLDCKKCFEECPTNSLGLYGEKISTTRLLEILKKDQDYYTQSSGGVTFSGGEPLLQADDLLKVLKILKDENIHVCIETSLFAPLECLKVIEDWMDLFIIDVKILDPDTCEKVVHGDLDDFKTNFKEIISKNKKYVLRFPLLKPYTFNDRNIDLLIKIIQDFSVDNLEIFGVHNFAESKYLSLGLKPKKYRLIDAQELEDLRTKLENAGAKVKILNL